jgi:hypothetical protein
MSLLGQKRTSRRGLKSIFVRFGPKADKHGLGSYVRYVPLADIKRIAAQVLSLHLRNQSMAFWSIPDRDEYGVSLCQRSTSMD